MRDLLWHTLQFAALSNKKTPVHNFYHDMAHAPVSKDNVTVITQH